METVADSVGDVPRNSFLLFVSLWTLLALAYLALAPKLAPKAAIPFALLGVDAVTMVFWFAGFIAVAVLRRSLGNVSGSYYYIRYDTCYGNYCDVLTAEAVFGAFNW